MTITTDDVKQKVFMVLDADPIREDSKFKSLQAATSCYIEIDKKSIKLGTHEDFLSIGCLSPMVSAKS